MKYLLLYLLIFLNYSTLVATKPTTPTIRFTNITKEDGLPSQSVSKVIKDKQGFMWIATNDGLCRYETPDRIKIYRSTGDTLTGLQSNNVHTIYADSKDHIWIATRQGGLSRLHQPSNTWKTFQHQPGNKNSISHNDVLAILEDRQGRIWIGTEDGLNLFQPATETFISFKVNTKQADALQAKAILSIIEDEKGWIWLGTWAGGLHLLLPDKAGNLRNTSFRHFKPKEDKGTHNIWDITQVTDDEYCIGTHGGGLVTMKLPITASNNPDSQDWLPTFDQYKNEPSNPSSLSHNDIKDIVKDHQGRIWLATGDGLNFIKPSLAKKEPLYFHKYVNSGDDPNSLLSNYVHSLYQDDQDLLWFGTSKGVSIYNPFCNQFTIYNNSPALGKASFYKNVHIDKEGQAWIATDSMGLVKYNVETQAIEIVKDKNGQALFLDKQNKYLNSTNDTLLYIGSRQGVGSINLQDLTTTFYPFPSPIISRQGNIIIRDIVKDRVIGNIWIATDYGLLSLEEQSGMYQQYTFDINNPSSISDNALTDILADSRGFLWISTYNGLNRINLNQATDSITFERFHSGAVDMEHRSPSNRLTALKEIGNVLYIGTTGGLIAYDFDAQKFTNHSLLEHKFWIESLEATKDNHIWGSTTESIFHFNTADNSFNVYEKEDGIGDVLFRSQLSGKDQQGNLYFGAEHTIFSFNPSHIQRNTLPPKVVITDIKTMSPQKVEMIDGIFLKELELEYNMYYFSVNFAALNFNRPEKNKYAYRLEGFEERWNYTTTNSSAIYTNLHPDIYTFHVKAANNDGVWNEEGRKITLIKKPAIWQTTWFKIANVLFIGMLVLVGFKVYTTNIKNRNKELQAYNEKLNLEIRERKRIEQAQLATDKKLRAFNRELIRSNKELEQFAYIASHDLQAPLTTIINFSLLLEKSLGNRIKRQEADFLRFIIGNTQNMQELVNAILEFSKINHQKIKVQSFSLQELIDDLRLELDAVIKTKHATILANNIPPIIQADKIKLKQILLNLISNGIKFSRIGVPPIIQISCTKQEAYWLFQVKDNGIGIDKEFNEKVFQLFQRLDTVSKVKGTGIGLSLCKKLVEQQEGKIWIESTPSEGSTFYFTIKAETTALTESELVAGQLSLA